MTTPTSARDAALATVERGVSEEWMAEATRQVRWLASLGVPFVSDTLKGLVPPPREPRAYGSVLMRAAKAGLIRPTGRYVPSSRAQCHARKQQEWIGVRQ